MHAENCKFPVPLSAEGISNEEICLIGPIANKGKLADIGPISDTKRADKERIFG